MAKGWNTGGRVPGREYVVFPDTRRRNRLTRWWPRRWPGPLALQFLDGAPQGGDGLSFEFLKTGQAPFGFVVKVIDGQE